MTEGTIESSLVNSTSSQGPTNAFSQSITDMTV